MSALNDLLDIERPAPPERSFSKPFWDATREKRLLLQYDRVADAFQFYPRPTSIYTGRRSNLEWREVSGKGKVFSHTIVRRARPPFRDQRALYRGHGDAGRGRQCDEQYPPLFGGGAEAGSPAEALLASAARRPPSSAVRAGSVIADLACREVDGWRGTIDLYLPDGPGPHPVLLYLHGGGWRMGSKASAAVHAPHWLAMGLAVAAPGYRLVETAPAPAAVEDARAALNWLEANGAGHGLDPARIVIAGHSAGGLLALAAGWRHDPAPAAVVAWSAHCDLLAYHRDRLAGNDPVAWLAESADPDGLAAALSPMALVRPGLPPTILIHSDRDPRVPFAPAARLAEALQKAGVASELVTMRSDGHLTGEQPPAEVARGHAATRAFLAGHGLFGRA